MTFAGGAPPPQTPQQSASGLPRSTASDQGGFLGTSDLGGFLGISDLGGFLGISDLGGFLRISDLGGFLGISDLGGFLGTSDLGCTRPPAGTARTVGPQPSG